MPSPKGTSSILLQTATKERLDSLKTHPRETYNDVVNRLIDCAEDPEPLSEDTLRAIEEGLDDVRRGRVAGRDEVMRRLGVE
jgi:predicted transcriptional regulator